MITSQTLGAHTLTIGGTNTYAGLNGTYTGTSRTDTSVKDALNAAFSASATLQKAGLQATVDGGHNFTIASNNGTSFRVNTSTTAAGADIGFGHAGAAFAGLTVNNSKVSVLDANGTTNTQAISFSALTYGTRRPESDGFGQRRQRSAANQDHHARERRDQPRNGRSLDETIGLINTQLQQSNNPTLQKIVAVKENDGSGGEKINFISSLASFSVGVGSSANGNALNGGTAASENSQALGTGSNVSVETKSGALLAVIGGRRRPSLRWARHRPLSVRARTSSNYAIGLAQSQISNFSAAESRIRDADVASEAANLTKAQVLQQAIDGCHGAGQLRSSGGTLAPEGLT